MRARGTRASSLPAPDRIRRVEHGALDDGSGCMDAVDSKLGVRMTRKTILLADDSPTVIKFEKMVLAQGPYELIVAQDGEEAVDRALSAKPDLILLDVMMPRMNGFDVCQRLRREAATRNTPIIMVTTRSDLEDMETGFTEGCNDYITKPVDARELLDKVQSWLGAVQLPTS